MNKPETVWLELPEECRILIFGDNHGRPELIHKVLESANYTKNEDFLIILGDIIEKGPDSIGALELVYRLCAKNDRVYMILGNVDRWCRRLLFGTAADALSYTAFRPENILTQAARRYGFTEVNEENYPVICESFQNEFGRICEWYFGLGYAVETEDLIFVHAGIGEGKTDYLADERVLSSNYDFFSRRVNNSGKWVVCGHMPCYNLEQKGASHCPVTDEANRIIFTDGGIFQSAGTGQQNLTVIRKAGTEYSFGHIYADGLPKVRVTASSKGNPSMVIRARYDDRNFELIRKGRFFSKIRLVQSGQEGYAKNELLVKDLCRCELNAFAEVREGEEVGLIRGGLEGFAYVKNAAGQLGFIPNHCLG